MIQVSALLLFAFTPFGQVASAGVLPPADGFRERAVSISQGGRVDVLTPPDTVFSSFVGTQLPPGDKGQFYLVVYVDKKSADCRLLLQDFERHPSLKVLRDWAKYTVIDRSETPSGEARHMAAALTDADVPTILVSAHPDHPVFGKGGRGGWAYAFAASGYGGDAALLARNIYEGLREHYAQHGVAEQCPGPYCPTPTPEPNRPEPYQPYRPSQPTDWDTPRLPRLDEQPAPFAVGFTMPSWGWFVLGVVVVVVLLAVHKRLDNNATKAGVVLLSLAAWYPAAADEAAPVPAKAETAKPTANDAGTVEDAYLLPPAPRDWEWLDRAVRDEVRRAIDPPRVEGFLLDSLNHVEVKVDNAVAGVQAEIRQEMERAKFWNVVALLMQVACVGLCAYTAWTVKQGA